MLRLPQIDAATARLAGMIFCGEGRGISVLGERMRLAFHAEPPVFASAAIVDATWGERPVRVTLDGFFFRDALEKRFPDARFARLPPPLRTALLAVALEEELAGLERMTGLPLALEDVRMADGQAAEDEALGFTLLSGSGQGVRGRLGLDAPGLEALAAAFQQLPAHRMSLPEELPIRLRFTVGETSLPACELRGIEPGDLILLDRNDLVDSEITVRLGARVGLRGHIDGRHFTIVEGMHEIMTDDNDAPLSREDNSPEGEPPIDEPQSPPIDLRPAEADLRTAKADEARSASAEGLLDHVDVRLVFDVGELIMPLGELAELAPGRVFDLGRPLRRAVQIRANGFVIGGGELVEIEGRIGVRVFEIKVR